MYRAWLMLLSFLSALSSSNPRADPGFSDGGFRQTSIKIIQYKQVKA